MILRIEWPKELLVFSSSEIDNFLNAIISGNYIASKRTFTLLSLVLGLVARWITMSLIALVNHMT